MALSYLAAFVPGDSGPDERYRLAVGWLTDQEVTEPDERLIVAGSNSELDRGREAAEGSGAIRFETQRTVHSGAWWPGGPLLLLAPSDRVFREWIDDSRLTAVGVLPGPGLEIAAWASASRAVNLADPSALVPEPVLDPVAAEAMLMLTNLVNTTMLGLEEDKASIVSVLEELRKAKVAFDATGLEAWALATAWSPQAARKLAEFAAGVLAGHHFVLREKPVVINNWTVAYWRERATRRAEHAGTLPEERAASQER